MIRTKLNRWFATMRAKRALLVGDFMLDTYIYGQTMRVSREAPVLVVRRERSEHRLGGAANTAANLAALGLQVEVIGPVGNDPASLELKQLLQTLNIDTTGLWTAEHPTPVKTRILAGAFGTARQQVLRLDDEPDLQALGLQDALLTAKILKDRLARADASPVDVLLLSDYGMGAILEPVVKVAEEFWQRRERPVCADSRSNLAIFKNLTLVKPNVQEAEALVGYALTSGSYLDAAGAKIVERLNCEACLLTQGRQGMSLYRRGLEPLHVGIVGEEEVTDVTGAGDTVLATISAGLAADLGFVASMQLANCAAGIVVTKMGAATTTPQEILETALRFKLAF